MSSLSHVHVEVAIKEFAAARRQIEALETRERPESSLRSFSRTG